MTNKSAGWGWEIVNIDNNGSDSYIQLNTSIQLTGILVDLAYMPTSAPKNPSYSEILCEGFVSPTLPTFGTGQAYANLPFATQFGNPTIVNPNGSIEGNSPQVVSGQLFAIILKSWVGNPPVASDTSRGVFVPLNLTVTAGEYLVFHMDHMGVPGDVEMQLTFFY